MNRLLLTGCGTALLTPFKNNEVDYQAFAASVERQVESGINFLVPLGSTAELLASTTKSASTFSNVAANMLTAYLLWWVPEPTLLFTPLKI